MKAMIRIVMASAILFASTAAFSQHGDSQRQRPSAEEMARKISGDMKGLYSLSDEQVRQVEKLFLENGRQREALMKEMQESAKKLDEGMKGILSDEQYSKWSRRNSRPHGDMNQREGRKGSAREN